MSDDPNIPNMIEKFWPFGAFIIGAIVSFAVGKERQRWRVDELGKQMEAQSKHTDQQFASLERRFQEVERTNRNDTSAIASVIAKQDMILSAIERLDKRLDGKADK